MMVMEAILPLTGIRSFSKINNLGINGRLFRCASTSNVNSSATPALERKKENVEEVYSKSTSIKSGAVAPPSFRFVYPEFLPDPVMKHRNKMREKLERMDMMKRRSIIEIPEFYAGCIMSVSVSDPHAQSKTSRFVGICIQRGGTGLRAWFTLRNVVENQGVEILYEMYNPTIQKIEVLRLEKRLDDDLSYLRDCYPEYSTYPFNMEPELHPEGAPVPVNRIKVKLKLRPWTQRWERKGLLGIEEYHVTDKMWKQAEDRVTPWEKYDLMKQYRNTIPEEQQNEIYHEVHGQLQQQEIARRKLHRLTMFTKAKKSTK